MEIILEEASKSAWLFNLKEHENVMLCELDIRGHTDNSEMVLGFGDPRVKSA